MSATIELWSDDQEFLNCKQAATFLGVSETSFYRMRIVQGIPYYLIGRRPKFKMSDLVAYREGLRRHVPRSSIESSAKAINSSKVSLKAR